MSSLHPTALVSPDAQLGDHVVIGPYAVIGPHVRIGARTHVHAHVVLDGHTTLGADCVVFPFASIGTQSQDLKYAGGTTFVEVGDRTTIREFVTINAGTRNGEVTRIGARCYIMAYAHIAHGCQVGNDVIMANNASLAGHVVVEDHAVLGGLCGIHQFVRIGRLAMIGGLSKVTQDCPPFLLIDGNPAVARGINRVGLERRGIPDPSRRKLKRAYRLLYRSGLNTKQAVDRIRSELLPCTEVDDLLNFLISSSQRGIVRGPAAPSGEPDTPAEHK